MTKYYEKLNSVFKYIRSITDFEPEIAIILGSGLGGFADGIKPEKIIDYSEIPNFPKSTVEGHMGRFILGYIENVPIIAMQGRVHFYEGYDIHDVVLPVRVMKMLGAEKLIITNASGGINPSFSAGELMLISDHISSFVPSPLVGENLEELGTRFPDMSHVYSPRLLELARESAKELGILLHEGVYVQTSGPNYETPAEIKMYKTLGADAVGMSTACEATAANHAGMEICAVSCISNLAAGISKTPLTHAEIKVAAEKAGADFEKLITDLIIKFSEI